MVVGPGGSGRLDAIKAFLVHDKAGIKSRWEEVTLAPEWIRIWPPNPKFFTNYIGVCRAGVIILKGFLLQVLKQIFAKKIVSKALFFSACV